jgi:hypothetical protein
MWNTAAWLAKGRARKGAPKLAQEKRGEGKGIDRKFGLLGVLMRCRRQRTMYVVVRLPSLAGGSLSGHLSGRFWKLVVVRQFDVDVDVGCLLAMASASMARMPTMT